MAVQINWRPLGRLLVEKGVLNDDELEQALSVQAKTGRRLGEVLVERGAISGPELTLALAEQWGIEVSAEGGFGSGLWNEIERRHRIRRETDAPPVLHVVEPLDEDEAPEPPEAPPAEVTALRTELDTLRAELACRDEQVADLERELDTLRSAAGGRQVVEGHLVFAQRGDRYALVDGEGAAPPVGAGLELDGLEFRVWKLGRSPLPGDQRLCAFALPHVSTQAD